LLRKTNSECIRSIQDGFECKKGDAGDRFLSELAGVSDPETKRKIIGRVFIEVLMMNRILLKM
jgi:GMP synthase (glutamine-hydrolysing)